jgi:hypothetical protein
MNVHEHGQQPLELVADFGNNGRGHEIIVEHLVHDMAGSATSGRR